MSANSCHVSISSCYVNMSRLIDKQLVELVLEMVQEKGTQQDVYMMHNLLMELSIPVQLICNLEQLFHHFFDLWILLFIWPSAQLLSGDLSTGVVCAKALNHIPTQRKLLVAFFFN